MIPLPAGVAGRGIFVALRGAVFPAFAAFAAAVIYYIRIIHQIWIIYISGE